jgi:hypothetical protein
MSPLVGTFRYYLTMKLLTLCDCVSRYNLHLYQIFTRSMATLENRFLHLSSLQHYLSVNI